MFADAVFVVCCGSLLVLVTAAADRGSYAQPRDYPGPVIEEEDVSAAYVAQPRRPQYATTAATVAAAAASAAGGGGGRSCCGGSSDGDWSSTVASFTEESKSPREVPLNLIMELNQVKNISELFTKFMPEVDLHEAQNLIATTGFQSRTTSRITERRAPLIPKPAGCSVEVQTISLKDTDDSSLYYYPPCTRVNRCGGCCAHDLLACQPTKTETVNFEVMVSQYNGAGKLDFIGRKAVSVIQHQKCKCDCIIKPEDCNPLQSYYRDECRCVCNNEEDREKCNEEHNLKLWNPANCSCQCREVLECTSGFGFDYNTCRCEALRTKIKNTVYQLNKSRYSLEGQ